MEAPIEQVPRVDNSEWESEGKAIQDAISRKDYFYPKYIRCMNIGKAWRCVSNHDQVGQVVHDLVFPSCTGTCKAEVTGKESNIQWNDKLTQFITLSPEKSPCDGSESRLKCKLSGNRLLDCTGEPVATPVVSQGSAKGSRKPATISAATFSGKDVIDCTSMNGKPFSCEITSPGKQKIPIKKQYDMVSCGGLCTSTVVAGKSRTLASFTATGLHGIAAGSCHDSIAGKMDVLSCMVARDDRRSIYK